MRAGSCEEKLGYLQNAESNRVSLIFGLADSVFIMCSHFSMLCKLRLCTTSKAVDSP